jgi:hypothetical protein
LVVVLVVLLVLLEQVEVLVVVVDPELVQNLQVQVVQVINLICSTLALSMFKDMLVDKVILVTHLIPVAAAVVVLVQRARSTVERVVTKLLILVNLVKEEMVELVQLQDPL